MPKPEPTVYQIFRITGYSTDQSVQVDWETNDGLDCGYPTSYMSDSYIFGSDGERTGLEKALSFVGKSTPFKRVYVNGELYV